MKALPSTSCRQLELLEHALGLNRCTPAQRRRYTTLARCYRNLLVAGPDRTDWPDLLELEQRQLMTRRDCRMECGLTSALFFVTEAGFAVLRMHGRVPAQQRELWEGAGDAV